MCELNTVKHMRMLNGWKLYIGPLLEPWCSFMGPLYTDLCKAIVELLCQYYHQGEPPAASCWSGKDHCPGIGRSTQSVKLIRQQSMY